LDFIVNVPLAAYSAAIEVRIKAIVRRYKLAGKRFAVDTF
jgi:tRNA(Ser,Leu) C12 N-acetylase TAN1